jgi:hypothetical protein
VPYKQDVYDISSKCKKNPKCSPSFAVEQLSHFFWKQLMLRDKSTPARTFLKSSNRIHQTTKPFICKGSIAVAVPKID